MQFPCLIQEKNHGSVSMRLLKKLKQGLVEHGIYKEVEQDYTNYALHFSLWNLNTVSKRV